MNHHYPFIAALRPHKTSIFFFKIVALLNYGKRLNLMPKVESLAYSSFPMYLSGISVFAYVKF